MRFPPQGGLKAMSTNLPRIASHEEWLAARKELLAKEKELTAPATRSARSGAACPWSR